MATVVIILCGVSVIACSVAIFYSLRAMKYTERASQALMEAHRLRLMRLTGRDD